MKKQKDKPLNTPLAKAFNFTHGDLESNRAGFVSHRQKQRLTASWHTYLIVAATFMGFGFICSSFLWFMVGTNELIKSWQLWNYSVRTVVAPFTCVTSFGGIGILILHFTLPTYRKLQYEVNKGIVETVIGSIEKKVISAKFSEHVIVINGVVFNKLSLEQFNVFESKGYYALYTTPISKNILSAEPISPEEIE